MQKIFLLWQDSKIIQVIFSNIRKCMLKVSVRLMYIFTRECNLSLLYAKTWIIFHLHFLDCFSSIFHFILLPSMCLQSVGHLLVYYLLVSCLPVNYLLWVCLSTFSSVCCLLSVCNLCLFISCRFVCLFTLYCVCFTSFF